MRTCYYANEINPYRSENRECADSFPDAFVQQTIETVSESWVRTTETVTLCENHATICRFCEEEGEIVYTGNARESRCEDHEDHGMCGDCNEVLHHDDLYYMDNMDWEVCIRCRDRNYWHCDRCDRWFSDGGDGCDCDSYDDYDDCNGVGHDDQANERGRLHDHDYTPSWTLYGDGDLRFGLELEMAAGDDCGDSVTDGIALIRHHLGDLALAKYDGSISDGLELVTHPATYDYLVGCGLADLLDEMRRRGWRSWSDGRAGLHVHVSRAAFRDPVHLFVFTLFAYRSHAELRAYSGRRGDSLDRWASFDEHGAGVSPPRSDRYRHSITNKVKGRVSGSKYAAINFQHEDSVEVRIFRGSLRFDTVLAALQMLRALVDFTRTVRAADFLAGLVTWSEFAAYAHERGDCPNFLEVAARRGVRV